MEKDIIKIFPELKESEDERIRKALKEYFINSFQNNGVAAICGVHIKDILAWLEKQGQKNLANSAKTCKDEQKPTNNQFTPEQASVLDKHIDKFLEQNPTWSEEDETKIKSIIAFLKSPSLCAMDGNKGIIDESIKYLNSLKDKVQPQPKQEWSEEDETMATNIIIMLKEGASLHFNKNDIAKGVDWLKSLKERVQPKQELSEEDEKMFKDIVARLHSHPNVDKTEYDKSYHWLKSLKDRYTWKPSEEQMEFLLKYAEQNNYDGSILTSLYQELKKLKG